MYFYVLQAQCDESLTFLKRERDRLDSMIVQSPERAARAKAAMEAKVRCTFNHLQALM